MNRYVFSLSLDDIVASAAKFKASAQTRSRKALSEFEPRILSEMFNLPTCLFTIQNPMNIVK